MTRRVALGHSPHAEGLAPPMTMTDDERRIMACTVPLLWPKERRSPQLIATAVALRIADDLFLLTAGHVVDVFLEQSFLLGHREALRTFSCRAERTVPTTGVREGDPVDVAVLRVDDGQLPTLREDAITPRDLALREWQQPVEEVFLAGYPESRYKALAGDKTFRYEPFRLTASRAEAGDLLAADRHPLAHVGLAFDPKDVTRDGRREQPPKLVGVSGGGLWHVPRFADPQTLEGPKLLAIFTEHFASRKLLVGTRVFSHCELIRAAYPHLSSHLGTHGVLEHRPRTDRAFRDA